jgi:hypothetical protein
MKRQWQEIHHAEQTSDLNLTFLAKALGARILWFQVLSINPRSHGFNNQYSSLVNPAHRELVQGLGLERAF